MGERWFGMCLPVLILILMEVILMSHGEGASASVAQQRAKRSIENVIKLQPSDARSYWHNQPDTNTKIVTRNKRASINAKRIKRSVSRYLPPADPLLSNNQHRYRYNEVPSNNDQVGINNRQENGLLAEYTDERTFDKQSSVDGSIDDGITSDIDDTNADLQLVDPESLHRGQNILIPALYQLANSVSDEGNNSPHNFSQNKNSRSIGSYLVNSVGPGIAQLLGLNPDTLDLYTVVTKLIVIIIKSYLKEMLHSMMPGPNPKEPPPPAYSPMKPMQAIADYLESTEPNSIPQENPELGNNRPDDTGLIGSMLNMLSPIADLLEPAKPVQETYQNSPPQSIVPSLPSVASLLSYLPEINPLGIFGSPSKYSRSYDDQRKPLQLYIDHKSSFKPVSNGRRSFRQMKNLLSPIKSIVDFFNPFKSTTDDENQSDKNLLTCILTVLNTLKPYDNNSAPPTQTIVHKLDGFGPQNFPPQPYRPYINPIADYFLKNNYGKFGSSAKYSRSLSGSQNPYQSVVDYFESVTNSQRPVEKKDDLLSSIKSVVEYLNPFKSTNDHEEPVQSEKSLSTYIQPIFDSLKEFAEYLKSAEITSRRPDKRGPQADLPQPPSLIISILDYLDQFRPTNDDQKPSQPGNNPMNAIQSIIALLSPSIPSSNHLKPVQAYFQRPDDFEPQTDWSRPKRPYINPISAAYIPEQNPIQLFIDFLNPSTPSSNHPKPIQADFQRTDDSEPQTDWSHPKQSYIPEKNPIQAIIDFFSPSTPSSNHPKPIQADFQRPDDFEPQTGWLYPKRPYINPTAAAHIPKQNPIQAIIDFFSPSTPASNHPKPSQADFQGPDDFKPQTDWLEPNRPYINPIVAHILEKSPYGIFGPPQQQSQLANNLFRPLYPGSQTDFYMPNSDIWNQVRNQLYSSRKNDIDIDPRFQRMIQMDSDNLEDADPPVIANRPAFYSSNPKNKQRPTREANSCPNIPRDYHRDEGTSRAYKFYTSGMNWNDADLKCRSDGAELVVPEDQAQYDFVVTFAKRMFNSNDLRFHVGFHRPSSKRSWGTVRGNPLPFEKWIDDSTSIDDPKEEECGNILVSDNSNGFTSGLCPTPLPFMCEIVISPHCA